MGWWLRSREGKPGAGWTKALLTGLMVSGLASHAQSFHLRTVRLNPESQAASRSVARQPVHVFREIKDAQTGTHWLILSNASNPAGPGRMVLAPEVSRSDAAAPVEKIAPVVAVHVGDRVTLEEHTRVAEAYLEAVALEPAVAGVSFHVRLKIGGKVVRVVAIAPGRAAFMPSSSVQP